MPSFRNRWFLPLGATADNAARRGDAEPDGARLAS
jgi:hypothetical protein